MSGLPPLVKAVGSQIGATLGLAGAAACRRTGESVAPWILLCAA